VFLKALLVSQLDARVASRHYAYHVTMDGGSAVTSLLGYLPQGLPGFAHRPVKSDALGAVH
jgi:hypothetical protein